MSRVGVLALKIGGALAILAVAAAFVRAKMAPSGDGGAATPPPLPAPVATGPDPALLRRIDLATDIEAPFLFAGALERETREPARADLLRLRAERAEAMRARVERKVAALLVSFRYSGAAEILERFREAWVDTEGAAMLDRMLVSMREEQSAQIRERCKDARALFEAHEFLKARESLQTNRDYEPRFLEELETYAIALEREMHGTIPVTPGPLQPGAAASAKAVAAPSPPPPLPGYPDPDVKRLAEARALLAVARAMVSSGRYQQAAKSLSDLLGFYGDLRSVARRRPAIAALETLARHETKGVVGLFRATNVKRSGSKITLHYTFASPEEHLDWEELATIPHEDPGEFRPTREGVQGSGVTSYLLRAWFLNDVTIQCEAVPNALKTHGLVFCQQGLETRQLMWILTNHWFVEGENYVKPRPGHSILMFGKGVNNDVPLDSPEVGFIFRGASITRPEPEMGKPYKLSFRLDKDTMSGTVVVRGDKGGRSGSCLGDDGVGIERVRPGLTVVENTVTFHEVTVEGRLHPTFEERRVAELLNLVTALDD
jgi:hypothetical protein